MSVFIHTDDADHGTRLDAWTNDVGDLHLFVANDETGETLSVYIRNASKFAKFVVAAVL